MPGTYANATVVATTKSRDEIESTLHRFGASHFAYHNDSDAGTVSIMFEIKGLRVLMHMTLPDREPFLLDSRGRERVESVVDRDYEQACRQRWRTLAIGIKAKLAMVDDGISTVEEEFLSNIVLPTGGTYGEFAIPQIAEVYRTHDLPAMLPGLKAPAPRIVELAARVSGG